MVVKILFYQNNAMLINLFSNAPGIATVKPILWQMNN